MGMTAVALLRGINVGGKNKLPMAVLASLFEKAGCTGVRTYIQSGNVVFKAAAGVERKIAAAVSKAIQAKCGMTVPVVVRTGAQLAAAVKANPFLKKGVKVETLHVMFLADPPAAAQVAGLDSNRSPGDAFIVRGGEIYLHLPNGAARTKLTNAYFDAKLKTVSTMRNWRTVLTLAEMAAT